MIQLKKPKSSLLYALLILTLGVSGCKNQTKTSQDKKDTLTEVEQTDSIQELPLPQVPSMLTDAQAQMDYILTHYWDKINFKDTTTHYTDGVLEQHWVNYIDRIATFEGDSYPKRIEEFMSKLNQGDKKNFQFYTKLADRYLYHPASPLRNDQLYRPFCVGMLDSPHLTAEEKERVQFKLELIDRNNVGQKAENFYFKTQDGKTYQLYNIKNEFTLLFFNNPGCSMCAQVIEIMKQSETLTFLEHKKRLQVVAVCPDGDTSDWREHIKDFPTHWLNGYDPDLYLFDNNLYDLRAIPSLYLLDKNHKVILKDADISEVIAKIEEML